MSSSTLTAAGSPFAASSVQQSATHGTPPADHFLLVDLSGGFPVSLAAHFQTSHSPAQFISTFDGVQAPSAPPRGTCVFVLPSRWSMRAEDLLRCVLSGIEDPSALRVCAISSFRAYLSDQSALDVESRFLQTLPEDLRADCLIVRTGRLLHPNAKLVRLATRWGCLAALLPPQARSCFISPAALAAGLRVILAKPSLSQSRYPLALLGQNVSLRELFDAYSRSGFFATCGHRLAQVLAAMQLTRVAGLLLKCAARFSTRCASWTCDTLTPRSNAQLLGLCQSENRKDVAIAGYNNGVTHFGWNYPGKTVVKTTAAGRLVRVIRDGDTTGSVVVDAGVTLKQLDDELAQHGFALPVMPNYSFISVGTCFMVPVHGSASEVSSLGECIERVVLYEPREDRIRVLRREDPCFGEYLYNPSSGVLVLRLRLAVTARKRYSMQHERIAHPTSQQIWRLLRDSSATNTEVRKSRAKSTWIDVFRYTATSAERYAALVSAPRDKIGAIWDRLEQNPLSSWLFHTLVRTLGYHVELFLDEAEFELFWRHHPAWPLSKIQLRYMRRDGFLHSPCRDGERISVDLFMPRSARVEFLERITEVLPHARFNPGKHSR